MSFILSTIVMTFILAAFNINSAKTCEQEQTEVLHASVVRLRMDAQECVLANSPKEYPLRYIFLAYHIYALLLFTG